MKETENKNTDNDEYRKFEMGTEQSVIFIVEQVKNYLFK